MMAGPSVLSVLAAGLYVAIAAAAFLALNRATSSDQRAWHMGAWGAIGVLFMILAVLRIVGAEDILRGELRVMLSTEIDYEQRGVIQKPLAVLILLAAAASISGIGYALARGIRGRRNVATLGAIACGGGMICLLALRLVSLHATDALLFGPLKLNWFLDIGMSLATLGLALRYWWVAGSGRG